MDYKDDYTIKEYISMILDTIGFTRHAKKALSANQDLQETYLQIIRRSAKQRPDIHELLEWSGLNICLGL